MSSRTIGTGLQRRAQQSAICIIESGCKADFGGRIPHLCADRQGVSALGFYRNTGTSGAVRTKAADTCTLSQGIRKLQVMGFSEGVRRIAC